MKIIYRLVIKMESDIFAYIIVMGCGAANCLSNCLIA